MNRKPTFRGLAALGCLPALAYMSARSIALLASVCVAAALAWPQASSAQVPLVFQTTFNCPDWTQGIGTLVCGVGIQPWGSWTTSNNSRDQITAAANYPGGGGGKGFRHFRGDGANNLGGGIRISLPAPVTEMWVRSYMRYSPGFAWTSGQPLYTKDHYWNATGANFLIFGIQGSASWGMHSVNGSTNYPSRLSWSASQGGPVGDGQWHCYEYHAKQNGTSGTIEVWVDGVSYLVVTNANLGSTPWSFFALGENQATVTGAGASDYYTDYDDLAISTTGRIGCIGPNALSAPANLRFQ